MFKLFSILKDCCSSNQQATAEELDFASRKKVLDPVKAKEWFTNLEAASQNIHQAFQKQAEVAAVSQLFKKNTFQIFIISLSRAPGIKVNLNNLLQNGLLPVISHLTRLKNQNSVKC